MRPFFAIFIVISLVSMQASGIHLHINANGAGGVHDTHIHETERSDHNHFGDTDVSLFELIRSAGQTFLFIATFVFSLQVVANCQTYIWNSRIGLLGPRHRAGWHPPLRAPPVQLS